MGGRGGGEGGGRRGGRGRGGEKVGGLGRGRSERGEGGGDLLKTSFGRLGLVRLDVGEGACPPGLLAGLCFLFRGGGVLARGPHLLLGLLSSLLHEALADLAHLHPTQHRHHSRASSAKVAYWETHDAGDPGRPSQRCVQKRRGAKHDDAAAVVALEGFPALNKLLHIGRMLLSSLALRLSFQSGLCFFA